MKKSIFLLMTLLLLCFSSIASADPGHNNGNHYGHEKKKHKVWSNAAYHENGWTRVEAGSPLPFRWYERHRERFDDNERIYDREWDRRFPGLRSYAWHAKPGHEFWYRGHKVANAVLFYDSDDELVSVGFMNNGAFIFIRDDGGYRNHDSFFISWSRW